MGNYHVSIEDDAYLDIDESYDWYFKISENLAERFLKEIEHALNYLEENPYLFQIVYKRLRQIGLSKFPYVIVYKIDNLNIKVIRVFPTRKDPSEK